MHKKNLYIFLMIIIILFILGIIIYPIFYNSTNNEFTNIVIDNDNSQNIEKIDVLSNLYFFKILVQDTNYTNEPIYSEKIVTIRDKESINELKTMINSAKPVVTNNARGYDIPTMAICYLDDNTMCSFFVADSNSVVFSDSESNKTIYQLDAKYDIDKFLTTLYNVNVNAFTYSIFNKNEKFGVKYSNNKIIINSKYDNIVIINPNIDVFAVTNDNITTFIDKSGENPFSNFENVELLPATAGGESLWYENALKYKLNEKYGLLELNGLTLLPAEYDKIEALNYIKDYIVIGQNGKEKIIKLCSSGFEEWTGEFDSIKILGADLNFTSKENKYLNSDSTIAVGINNGVREQYFELYE